MSTKPTCIRRPKPGSSSRRRAVTMLELVIASSMLALIVTSLSLVLRSARTAWEANDNDYAALHHAHTVARHFVRQARQAQRVTELSRNGRSITLEMQDGRRQTWSHGGGSGELKDVVFLRMSATGQDLPLAYNIRNLSFIGFEADGMRQAKDVDDVRLLQVVVTVVLPRGANAKRTVASKVWIRSW